MDVQVTPSWSCLPEHILALIAKHLETRIDILRFRAVCNSFRSSLLPPRRLCPDSSLQISIPLEPLPIPRDRSHTDRALVHYIIYAIEPLQIISNGSEPTKSIWLVKIQESNPCEIVAEHPLFREYWNEYAGTMFALPKSLNLLDFCVKQIAKVCELRALPVRRQFRNRYIGKTVCSTCVDESDDAFAVMNIWGSKLGMWRNVDKKWTEIDFGSGFKDIVCHNKTFYALCSEGLISVDSKSLKVTRVSDALEDESAVEERLVESSKNLFLIRRYEAKNDCFNFNREVHFKVLKLDEERYEWVDVSDELEGRVLFVGDGHSFSVSSKEFPECQGNCVVFIYRFLHNHDDNEYDRHPRVFSLKDNTVGSISDFLDASICFYPPHWLREFEKPESEVRLRMTCPLPSPKTKKKKFSILPRRFTRFFKI